MTPASKLPLEARMHLLECASIDVERRARDKEIREKAKDVEILRMVRWVRWMCVVAIVWIVNLIVAPVIVDAFRAKPSEQLERAP